MTFGRDTYCYDSIRTGRVATGVELLGQALFRRLITPRGTLRDGDEGLVYGLDVLGFVGMVGTAAAVDAIPDAIRAECLKDDRVDRVDASASITRTTDGLATILVDLDVFPADADESFTLSVSVSEISVTLLGITQ
jgi:hypothetical protein